MGGGVGQAVVSWRDEKKKKPPNAEAENAEGGEEPPRINEVIILRCC